MYRSLKVLLLVATLIPTFQSINHMKLYAQDVVSEINELEEKNTIEDLEQTETEQNLDIENEENNSENQTESNVETEVEESSSEIVETELKEDENKTDQAQAPPYTEVVDDVYVVSDEEKERLKNEEKAPGDVYQYNFHDGGDISNIHPTHVGRYGYFVIDGEISFCIEPLENFTGGTAIDVGSNNSAWNALGSAKRAKIKVYTSVGKRLYEENRGERNAEFYLYATQVLIWDVIDSRYHVEPSHQAYANKVQEAFDEYYKIPSFTKPFGEAVTHTLTWNTSRNRYEITLQDTEGVLDANFSSIFGYVNSGYHFENGPGSDTLLIWTTNHNAGQLNNVRFENSYGLSYVRLFEAPQTIYEGVADPSRGFMNVKIKPAVGDIKVTKEINNPNSTNVPLSCSNFVISGSGASTLAPQQMRSVGGVCVAEYKNVLMGDYKINETNNSSNHVVVDSSDTGKLSPGGKLNLEVTNEVIDGRVKLNKIGQYDLFYPLEHNIDLEGAEFTIYDSSNNVVQVLTTDSNGYAISDWLKAGNYTIKETHPPEGYISNPTIYKFKIDKNTNHKTQTINSGNPILDKTIIGEAHLKKVGETTENNSDDIIGLEGARFDVTDVNGDYVRTVYSDENGDVYTGDLVYGSYTICEITPPTGYEIVEGDVVDSYCEDFKIRVDGEIVKLKGHAQGQVYNLIIEGGISLYKFGETLDQFDTRNVPLEGTEFTIYDIDGEYSLENPGVVDVITTDSRGHAEYENLKVGKYLIKETRAIPGYINSGFNQEFEITYDGQMIDLNNGNVIYNDVIKGQARVKKAGESLENNDPNLHPLKGAEFEIYIDENNNKILDSNDTYYETITSSTNGYATTSELKYGNYIIKEIQPPEGYLLQPGYQEAFSITTHGEVKELNGGEPVLNEEIRGNVEIRKQGQTLDPNSNSNVNLEGTEFTIYDIDDRKSEVATITTDSNGYAKYEGLKYGKYSIEETTPSQGYQNSGFVEEFSITQNNQMVSINNDEPVKNDPIRGRVELDKVAENFNNDDSNLYPLEGATFEIYADYNENQTIDPGDVKIDTLVTDSDGYAISSDLKYGSYIIKETGAPTGYIIEPVYQEAFKITTNNQIIKLNNGSPIKNDNLRGSVEIDKIGESLDPTTSEEIGLAGTVFTIYDIDGPTEEIVGTMTTNSLGHASYGNLKYGDYKVVETTPTTGYINSGFSENFSITTNGQIVKLNSSNPLENKAIKGKVELDKVGENFNNHDDNLYPLENAIFKIYGDTDKDGTIDPGEPVVQTLTTDRNGYAISDDLKYGNYVIKETSPPIGYINPTPFEEAFTIKTDGELIKLNQGNHIINDEIRGAVEINKIGETLLPNENENVNLEGTEFTVYDIDGPTNGVVGTMTTNSQGYATMENLKYGKYEVKETTPSTGYLNSGYVEQFEINTHGQMVTLNGGDPVVNDPIKGKVELIKVAQNLNNHDDDYYPLQGAIFEIYHDANNNFMYDDGEELVDTLTTDADGYAISKDLKYGNYVIKETYTPPGYILGTPYEESFQIRNDGEIIKLNNGDPITNQELRGSVEISKIGETLIPNNSEIVNLEGAEFTVYDIDGPFLGEQEVGKMYTNVDGYAKMDQLKYGEYKIVETKPPTGYINSNFTEVFTISEDGEIVTINTGEPVVNEPIKGQVELEKIAQNLNNHDPDLYPLQGAEFEIYDDVDENGIVNGGDVLVQTIQTDENGYAISSHLKYGSYVIKESKAPTGYLLEPIYEEAFNITTDGEIIKLNGGNPIENKEIRGSVNIRKIGETLEPNENNSVNLEGTEFTVYDIDGPIENEVGVMVTDSTGYSSMDELKYGKYKVVETKPSEGYINSGFTQEFWITEDGEMIDLNYGDPVYNKAIRGQVELNKIAQNLINHDDDLYPLEGAKFEIYHDSDANFQINAGDEYVETLVTNDEGYAISSKLKYGNYVIKEVEAPTGYLLEPIFEEAFKITTEGEIITLNSGDPIINKEIRGAVEINKIGESLDPHSSSDVNLKDTEFTIYDTDGPEVGEVGKIITDENGYGKFDDLKYGEYKIVETKPSEGYVNSGFSETFFIKDDGVTVTVNDDKPVRNYAIRGQVELRKFGENFNNWDPDLYPLKDAEFTIYPDYNKDGLLSVAEEAMQVETIVTDINGYAISSRLKYGNYIIKETKAPTGYLLQPAYQEAFKIENDGEIIKLNGGTPIVNEEIRGSIDINKIGTNLDPHSDEIIDLKDTEFTVYDIDGPMAGEVEVGKIITDENGYGKLDDLKYGEYKIVETKPSEGYVNSGYEEVFFIEEDGVTIHLNDDKPVFNRAIRGQVELRKFGENFSNWDPDLYPLKDAEFTIYPDYNANGEIDRNELQVETLVTDINGYAISSRLKYGNYIIKETKAPTGYLLQPVYQEAFKIENDGEIVKLNGGTPIVNEEIRGSIDINKIGANLDPHSHEVVDLKDTEFTVYDIDGPMAGEVEVGKIITDENGYGKLDDLKYGEYKIVETKPSEGYVNSGYEEVFFIEEDGVTIHLNNEKPVFNRAIRGQVELRKFGENFNNWDPDLYPLKDAEFTIYPDYNANGEIDKNELQVETLVTDINGYAISSKLKYGNYIIKETKSPTGYLLQPVYQEAFKIENDGEIIKLNGGAPIVNEEIRGSIDINKIGTDLDPYSDEIVQLKDTEFTVYDIDGPMAGEVGKIITDENGFGKLDDLKYGEYKIVETKPSEGYVNSGYEEVFFIEEDGITIHLNNEEPVFNSVITGQVELEKVAENFINSDDQLYPLKDTEFTIYRDYNANGEIDEDEKEIETLVTDENGYAISSKLKYGNYVIKETKAPTGYIVNYQEAFKIENDGEIVKLGGGEPIENDVINGKADIVKVGTSNNGNYTIEGARFDIYEDSNKNGKIEENEPVVDSIISNQVGYGISGDLKFGSYVIKETKQPNGYVTPDFEEAFIIDEDGEIITIGGGNDIENERIENYIEITKKDQYEKAVEGAEFTIYSPVVKNEGMPTVMPITDKETTILVDGEEVPVIGVETLITDSDGYAKSSWLGEGTYYLKETKAPSGYVLDSKIEKFVISEETKMDQFSYSFVNELIDNDFEIQKTDQFGESLSDVEFTVYEPIVKNDGGYMTVDPLEGTETSIIVDRQEIAVKEVEKLVTDKNGNVKSKLYNEGIYYIKETKGLDGYVNNEEIITFEVNEENNDEVFVYDIINEFIEEGEENIIIEEENIITDEGPKIVKAGLSINNLANVIIIFLSITMFRYLKKQ